MGGRRSIVVAVAAVVALVTIGGGVVLLRPPHDEPVGDAVGAAEAISNGDGSSNASGQPALPTPAATDLLGSADGGGAASESRPGGSAEGPGAPEGSGGDGSPPEPPPQPPPSRPAQPTPIPCTVSVSAGPMPGVPNIRIVVTAAPNVDMLWATVTEGSRALRGAIALTGGRGEQIVDGVSQGARVTIFSDASMAEPTLSCSTSTR